MTIFRPLIVMGTRPEAIKLSPVVLQCKDREGVEPIVCSTGQHREMLDQVLGYFGITPDIDLNLMRQSQTLSGLTALLIESIDRVLVENPRIDAVVVQGDTTTVMAASMVAFYHRKPIVHVEAGLRTGDLDAPWPEEFNRRVAGIVANLHCAPTETAAAALRREHVAADDIRVTGNTVIDALLHSVVRERDRADHWQNEFPMIRGDAELVLITGHRRENFGGGLANSCSAIARLAKTHPQADFLYPVHLNPNVRGPVHEMLGGLSNVHLVPPADYPAFVYLMDRASVVLTDSGGVQEEAPSLGCDVFVTREKTERPEAVDAGLVELVGTDPERIFQAVDQSLRQKTVRDSQRSDASIAQNPYGDGKAAARILDWMLEMYRVEP